MTRTYTKHPVWTWVCDGCGREESLSRDQTGLPEAEQMRQRGWFIASLFGDKCPECVLAGKEKNDELLHADAR